MKKYPHIILLTAIFTSLILLIVIPDICVDGAKNGILLWFNTIIPTLFPFFVVTRLIIELNLCPDRLMPLYPVFVGMLSGYPAGAMTISEMIKRNKISKENGQILMIFCNNASPVFMISYVALYCLGTNENRYIIWLSVIPASVITAVIIKLLYGFIHADNRSRHKSSEYSLQAKKTAAHTTGGISLYDLFEQVIIKSCEVLLMIGAYIIIFSIAANIILQLPIPGLFSVLISGFLEITTGINLIAASDTALSETTRYITAAFICGFGGISALLQTMSAVKASGLSIYRYFIHKLICGVISGAICYIIYSRLR